MTQAKFPMMLDSERAKYVNREIKYEEEIKSLRKQLAKEKSLHLEAVKECHRAFGREAAIKKEMARRDVRGSNPRTSPQLGWDILRQQGAR